MKLQLKNIFALSLVLFFQVYGISIKQVSIPKFMEEYSSTDCIQCTKQYSFDMTPFPLYQDVNNIFFPSKGVFKDIFILQIQNGTALCVQDYYSGLDYLFINNCFIQEMQIKYFNWFTGSQFEIGNIPCDVKKKTGRVAIIAHHFSYIYGHWIFDILGQLALLEMHNVEYDYLCIPHHLKFMKETLKIWNIDSSKIIPLTYPTCIQADTIIISTPVTQIEGFTGPNANYNTDFVLQYIRNKLLSRISTIHEPTDFSKKVFISRQNTTRSVPNEDEIFALFEPLGFKRYELTSLSLAEQITLFYNAQSIVSFVGSGSTNIIFCRPGTHFIEIQQNTVDATFFYASDIFRLKYSCINNSTSNDLVHGRLDTPAAIFPLELVEKFLREHEYLDL